MTYSQPQQQPQRKPNRTALWINTRKQQPNQPDYKGNVELSWDLIQEVHSAFMAGQYEQDIAGRAIIKLDVAIYAQAQSGNANSPVMSGQLSSLAETQHSAQMRAQYKAQQAQGGQGGGYPQVAPTPQQYQPQAAAAPPQPQYAATPVAPPAAPAPAPAPAYPQVPAAPAAPMQGAIHGQPPTPAAPMAPGQQLPQGF